jgi:lysozyme
MQDAPITKAQAVAMLLNDIERVYYPGVMKLCPNLKGDAQICAIVDFAYNLGLGALKGSTLRKRLNAGDIEGALVELAKWNKGGGKVLKGLVLRRQAEGFLLASS